jgi:hypothetical protein
VMLMSETPSTLRRTSKPGWTIDTPMVIAFA